MSRRTRCKVETIRYYERAGLMPAPPRSSGGYHLYNQVHLKR
ncbi:MAG: MerR family DNA-binding transcriptional regulator, partial [Pseudomonadota bacterium]|nr:MerR family DNA-binding transcriptional regulator [Pseudomonadota bacterium]